MLEALKIPDDIDAFVASLTDEEADEMAAAIIAHENVERYTVLAQTFPRTETWPPDYPAVYAWRTQQAKLLDKDPAMARAAKAYYRENLADFIEHWCITYDPRNAGQGKPSKMPLILFKRQREFVAFLLACLKAEESGLVEKSRDMGATWVSCALSVGIWLFLPGSSVGWGSRIEDLVDKLGDPDSIFEKMRMTVRALPKALLPRGFNDVEHMAYMKFINPETDSTITGASGDNIGRGGRSLIFFKDESAHYARPEKIEAALSENARVQIDISSVNGLGNVFHRRREAGKDWIPGEPLEKGRTAVFVMDWRDHPDKSEDWYRTRRQKFKDDGLLHVFAQEVDRNYSAAVEGTIIPAEWVKSAIDAHIVLGIEDDGPWTGALDVADGGGDANADAWFKGIVLREADAWGARDTAKTTERFLGHAEGKGHVELQYDAGGGYGSGIKAEANRLADEGMLSPMVRLVPWVGSAAPLDPDKPIIEDDRDSPTNRDFFENLKAQGWWRTRTKFEKTHRAVLAARGEGPPFTWRAEELISIDSRIPLLRQIEKELSQPTRKPNTRRLVVDKSPEGTPSPNLGDAIIMADNPTTGLRPVYPVAPSEVEQTPFKVPTHWKRGYAMKVEPTRVTVLWAAFDPHSDVLYIVSEHSRSYAEPSANAQAILARGQWQPGFLETDKTALDDIRQVIDVYRSLNLRVDFSERALEAGISDMHQRVSTGRLKAFATCTEFFKEYRSYRRAEDGDVIGSGLIDCARILCRPSSLQRMIVKPAAMQRVAAAAHVGDSRIGY